MESGRVQTQWFTNDESVRNANQSSEVRIRGLKSIYSILICGVSLILLLICLVGVRNEMEKIRGRLDRHENIAKSMRTDIKQLESIVLPNGTGKVDWILDHYTFRVQEAFISTSRPLKTIRGPSFYTKGFGYKLGIHFHFSRDLYLVSIREMDGAHDNLLVWPVAGDITVTFVNHIDLSNSTAIQTSFINDESNPCRTIHEGLFAGQNAQVCRFELLANKAIGSTHLIYNDSLHIRVEVEPK